MLNCKIIGNYIDVGTKAIENILKPDGVNYDLSLFKMYKDGPVIIIEDDPDDQFLFKDAFKELNYSNEIIFFSDVAKAAKTAKKKKRPKQYEPKAKFEGTFEDMLKISATAGVKKEEKKK
ncbi:MAG TPA: hypothetical protein VEV62_07130 [Parafilimonas sp.]|jgi:hypothetical protein|nr:hypothetical protein [Parafilimonas sp.]